MKGIFDRFWFWLKEVPGVAWFWIQENAFKSGAGWAFVFGYAVSSFACVVDRFIPSVVIGIAAYVGAHAMVKWCHDRS